MGDLVNLAIFSLTVSMVALNTNGQTYNQTSQLMSSLLSNYDPTIRPVIDQSKVVTITALMLLGAIRTVNEKEQTISIRLYCWIWWEDELLTWTPSDHGNITAISPQIQQVWKPTLNLAGSVSNAQLLVDTSEITPVYVNYTGTVVWAPNILLEQLCKMDMTKFPMDEHNCTFLIYSVGSSTSEISLQYAQENLDLRQYTVNGEWELLKTETSILTFDTGVSPSFYYISLSLIIKRRPRFFLLNLLMPTLALSFLNILVFILPADSGEKVGYSITVLLSVMLMMGVTTDVLPESSDVVPLITQFLTILTLISVLSVVVTVAILFVHHSEEQETKKKRNALSFIDKLKQKVALKSSISPADQKGKGSNKPENGAQWNDVKVQPSENTNGMLVTSDDMLESEMETSGNGHLNCNSKQVNFVEAMRNEQSCLAIDPPMENGVSHRSQGQFFSMAKDADGKIGRTKPGPGGIASLWFRGKQNDCVDKHQSDSASQFKNAGPRTEEQKSKAGKLWKEMSKHLDTICFWVFLTAWLTVTLGFFIAIFA